MTISTPQPGDYAPPFQTYVDAAAAVGDDALAVLDGQEALLAAMASWPEAKAGHRYAEGKWTVREVIGHLADAERIFAYRLLRIARGDATPLAAFDENAYQQTAGFDARSLADVVAELRAVRAASFALVRSLDAAALDREGTASNKRTTARALVWITAGHVQHHAVILRDRYGM